MPTFAATNPNGGTGSIQTWTVPSAGQYKVEAWGAQGGRGDGLAGGSGAYISAVVNLNAGEVIKIIVGQQGTPTTSQSGNSAGGGGGGSFVLRQVGNAPLVIAAGGNGGSWVNHSFPGEPGKWYPYDAPEAAGGTAGRGGGGGTLSYNGNSYSGQDGGSSVLNNSYGGIGSYGTGGFGGGGGSTYEGGGGGGWVGGTVVATNSYGSRGASALSYVIPGATQITGTDGTRSGAGQVVITPYNTPPTQTIITPVQGQVIQNNSGASTVTVSWTYSDPDSNPQSAYSFEVWRLSDNTQVFQTGAVASSATSGTFPMSAIAQDGLYELRVGVNDGTVWSQGSNITFESTSWTTLNEVNSSAASGYIDAKNLQAGTYEVRVRANDGNGWSEWSDVKSQALGPASNIYVKDGGTVKVAVKYIMENGVLKPLGPTIIGP